VKVIPAVDIMGGCVVRLRRGDRDAVIRYDHVGEPSTVALGWERQGAELIHLIDLDGAFDSGSNVQAALEISEDLDIPMQFGGGVRDEEKAIMLLDSGVFRVILGSMAVRNPEGVYRLASEYGDERVAVALDHSGGKVVYAGWTERSRLKLEEAVDAHLKGGVRTFLVTSQERDGTLDGPDIVNLRKVTRRRGARVMAAGGIGSLEDIQAIRDAGADGAVMGRALYEGRFTLGEAMAAAVGP